MSCVKIRYENRVHNNWRILYKLDGVKSIAKCNLCNKDYSVRTCDVVNGRSQKCVSCANAGNTKIVEGVLLGDWKVIERYNYKSVRVRCVLCGFERTMRPCDASKYLCGCKRGLVYDGNTFDKVKDLYNYLQPKLKTQLGYAKFSGYLKNRGIDWIIESFLGCVEHINYAEVHEGKVYGNWKILKYITSENCIAQCLLCNRVYKDVNTKNVTSGFSKSCAFCGGSGLRFGTMRATKVISDLGDYNYLYKCECKICGYEDILTSGEMIEHKCEE